MPTVYFIDHNISGKTSGSSYLRTIQLSDIIKNELAHQGIRVEVTTNTHNLENSILLFSKNAIERTHPIELLKLKFYKNRIIADIVDGKISNIKTKLLDHLIFSSKSQYNDSLKNSSLTPKKSYVEHHVDIRIPIITPPKDQARIGYFGEPNNAKFYWELNNTFDFIKTDTSDALNTQWMHELNNYNIHYLLRNKITKIHKPFTKGFIAAHCDSAVICDIDDTEARLFLPSDYPYFIDTTSLENVNTALLRIKNSFGTNEWSYAMDAMKRIKHENSIDLIKQQLIDVISIYLT